MKALVLGGGGARGAYEFGVWKALRRMDIDIDLVVGTSIGAVNSALVAQGDIALAEDLWRTYDAGKLIDLPDYRERETKERVWAGLQKYAKSAIEDGAVGIDPAAFQQAIAAHIDEQRVRDSKIRMGVMTVDLQHLTPVAKFIDEMPQGQLIDYIMASCSLVPALKPHEIDGVKYIDGGYYDNIPIELAQQAGATSFIVVDLDSFGRIRRTSFDQLPQERITYIRPYWTLGASLLFDARVVERNEALGYNDAMKAFGCFDGNAYTFIKDQKALDIERMKKDTEMAKRLGLYFNRRRTVFDDQLLRSKWSGIVKEREKRTHRSTNDLIAAIEIAAEILEIDPTKIYALDTINERLRAELARVELPPRATGEKSPRAIVQSIAHEIETMTDDKKRLKFFAREIQRSLAGDSDLTLQQIMAGLYTKTFVAALYLAMQRLI